MSYQGPDERYAAQAEGSRGAWQVAVDLGRGALAYVREVLADATSRPVHYDVGHAMMLGGVPDAAQAFFIREQAAHQVSYGDVRHG